MIYSGLFLFILYCTKEKNMKLYRAVCLSMLSCFSWRAFSAQQNVTPSIIMISNLLSLQQQLLQEKNSFIEKELEELSLKAANTPVAYEKFILMLHNLDYMTLNQLYKFLKIQGKMFCLHNSATGLELESLNMILQGIAKLARNTVIVNNFLYNDQLSYLCVNVFCFKQNFNVTMFDELLDALFQVFILQSKACSLEYYQKYFYLLDNVDILSFEQVCKFYKIQLELEHVIQASPEVKAIIFCAGMTIGNALDKKEKEQL